MREYLGREVRRSTVAPVAAVLGYVALHALAGWTALLLAASIGHPSHADEDGVSFWLPGTYGSLAAVPGEPGWSLAGILYHTSVSAGRGEALSRGGNVRLGLDSDATLLLLSPSYTLKRTVLGGQAAVSLMGIFGRNSTSVDATLDRPGGNQISGAESDSLTSFGDLYPQASLKWNSGVNNAMVYLTGDIPVGSYESDRLSNLGIGHGAIDAGYGYTYFDSKKGHEFSAVLGLTYNFENSDTDYRNGIDAHPRSSYRRTSRLAPSATSISRSPMTAARVTASEASSRGSPASAHSSATFSRPERCKATSTSRGTTSSTQRTGPTAGTSG